MIAARGWYLAESGVSQLQGSAAAAHVVLNSRCWRSLSALSRDTFLYGLPTADVITDETGGYRAKKSGWDS